MNKRVIKLQRRAKLYRGAANEDKLQRQMLNVIHLCDFKRDPRATYHLDTTKLAHHMDRVEAWRRGEPIAPVSMDIALTQRCSYSCTFCYAGLQQNPKAPVSWDRWELFLHDAAEVGVKAISLVSDGESTENDDWLRFAVLARSLGIDIAIGTNGLRLADFETCIDTFTYIRINFNAAAPAAYARIMGTSETSFETVIDNIDELVRVKRERGGKGATIGLQMVLMPEYADQVIPVALLGRQLGVDYTIIKHVTDDEDGRLGVDYGWYKSAIAQQLFKVAEGLSTPEYSVQAKWSKFKTGRDRTYSKCFGPPLLLQCSGSGVLAPCGSFFEERYSAFHFGNLQTDRFRDVIRSDRYRAVMARISGAEFDPRKQCATLCLQDKVNEALFAWVEHGTPIPPAKTETHVNFL